MTTPQEPTAQEDANLFDDNFHEWLEAHGVVVGSELEEQGWRAHIDLNVLKLAILHLADHSYRLGMKNGRFGYVTEAEASRREQDCYLRGAIAEVSTLIKADKIVIATEGRKLTRGQAKFKTRLKTRKSWLEAKRQALKERIHL